MYTWTAKRRVSQRELSRAARTRASAGSDQQSSDGKVQRRCVGLRLEEFSRWGCYALDGEKRRGQQTDNYGRGPRCVNDRVDRNDSALRELTAIFSLAALVFVAVSTGMPPVVIDRCEPSVGVFSDSNVPSGCSHTATHHTADRVGALDTVNDEVGKPRNGEQKRYGPEAAHSGRRIPHTLLTV